MDPQKIKEIKMLRRASRASNTEHLKRQNSQNQSITSDDLQKTSTRELLGDSHSKLGFDYLIGPGPGQVQDIGLKGRPDTH